MSVALFWAESRTREERCCSKTLATHLLSHSQDPVSEKSVSSLLFKRNGVKRTHSDQRLKQSSWISHIHTIVVPPPVASMRDLRCHPLPACDCMSFSPLFLLLRQRPMISDLHDQRSDRSESHHFAILLRGNRAWLQLISVDSDWVHVDPCHTPLFLDAPQIVNRFHSLRHDHWSCLTSFTLCFLLVVVVVIWDIGFHH